MTRAIKVASTAMSVFLVFSCQSEEDQTSEVQALTEQLSTIHTENKALAPEQLSEKMTSYNLHLPHQPNRLLVITREGEPESIAEDLLTASKAKVESKVDGQGVHLLTFSDTRDSRDLLAVAELLAADARIEAVEANILIQTTAVTPNDQRFGEQWAFHNTGQAVYYNGAEVRGRSDADIDIDRAWVHTKGNKGVKVAILDSGIDCTHEDLADNCWVNVGESGARRFNGIDDDGNGYVDDHQGYNFISYHPIAKDDQFHGTHVAGIVGAKTNNGLGVGGVNWNVSLVPVKVLNDFGLGTPYSIVAGLDYAIRLDVQVINLSLGTSGFSYILERAMRRVKEAGILVVAAAGNNARDVDVTPNFPSGFDFDNIIAVAATDNRDRIAWFSNWGKESVDIAAPGAAILSTLSRDHVSGTRNQYTWSDGTSMATPMVAGAAALLYSLSPNHDYRVVKEILLESSDLISDSKKTATRGRLNVARAVNRMLEEITPVEKPQPPTGLSVRAISGSEVEIVWNDVQGERKYNLQRRRAGSGWQSLTEPDKNQERYVDHTVESGATYYYRIAAQNSAGASAYAYSAAVITPWEAPAKATGVTSTFISKNQVVLRWDNIANEDGYIVYHKIDGSYVEIGRTNKDERYFLATELAKDQRHYFRVRALNSVGKGLYSDTFDVKTTKKPSTYVSGLFAEPAGGAIQVEWDAIDDEKSFVLKRKASLADEWENVAKPAKNSRSFVDRDVESGRTYYYTIKAKFDSGKGPLCNITVVNVP